LLRIFLLSPQISRILLAQVACRDALLAAFRVLDARQVRRSAFLTTPYKSGTRSFRQVRHTLSPSQRWVLLVEGLEVETLLVQFPLVEFSFLYLEDHTVAGTQLQPVLVTTFLAPIKLHLFAVNAANKKY
jgi:hypothetical protein